MISRVAVPFFFPLKFSSFFSASSGRAALHGKASLQIDPVRSEDQGWYECRVLMLEQQSDTFHNGSWVHLTVNGESPAHGADWLCSVRSFLCVCVCLSLFYCGERKYNSNINDAVIKDKCEIICVFILIIVTGNNWMDLSPA